MIGKRTCASLFFCSSQEAFTQQSRIRYFVVAGRDLDGSLSKASGIPKVPILGENAKFEIRVDAFNLLNNLNFNVGSISTAISNDGIYQQPNLWSGPKCIRFEKRLICRRASVSKPGRYGCVDRHAPYRVTALASATVCSAAEVCGFLFVPLLTGSWCDSNPSPL